MYQNNPQNSPALQLEDEKVEKDRYFIIDWVCANPMKPGRGTPVIVVGNASEEDMQNILKGVIKIEDPRMGTRQRALVKTVQVLDLKE